MIGKRLSVGILAALLAVVTALVSFQSVVALFVWSLVAMVLHRWFLPDLEEFHGEIIFLFYCAGALVLYLAQLGTYPAYQGFSGGLGIGTDDSHFYSQVARGLPWDFPVRRGYDLVTHPFSHFLSFLTRPFSWIFPRSHPLEFLYLNALAISLLPPLTAGLARHLFRDERVTRGAYLMTLFCPFILANGLILMRDGWMAMLFTGGLYFTLKRRWLPLAVFVGVALFLRMQTGLMLLGNAIVLSVMFRHVDESTGAWNAPGGMFRTVMGTLPFALVGIVAVLLMFGVGWSEKVFRGDFLEGLLRVRAAADSGTSTFYMISQLPWFFRIPLAVLFYLGSPFFSYQSLFVRDLWIPRAFMFNTYALAFPVYAGFFTLGVLKAFTRKHVVALFLLAILLLDLASISQASMQLRHKIPLMPIFYLLVAFGFTNRVKQHADFARLVALGVVALNVLVLILQLS